MDMNTDEALASFSHLMSPDEYENAMRFLGDNPAFKAITTRKERQRFLAKKIREMRKEQDELGHEHAKKVARLEHVKQMATALDEILKWANGSLVLERPDGSMFRNLRKAVNRGEALYFSRDKESVLPARDYEKEIFSEAEILVVEHDWSMALGNAGALGDPIKLPYDMCAFEFKITGRSVIALATQFNSDVCFTPVVLTSLGWSVPDYALHIDTDWTGDEIQRTEESGYIEMMALVDRQIRAICIALDAEVAKTEVVREAHTGQAGKNYHAPLRSYHVVSLAHRSRTLPQEPIADTGRRVRLHFRRGHWRHFETHKTWIKWMLVGNPDLGFIDKHYRL